MSAELDKATDIAQRSSQHRLYQYLKNPQIPTSRKELTARRVLDFEARYPGGLAKYTSKIVDLMEDCVRGKTKYDDVVLTPPETVELGFEDFDHLKETDEHGIPELKKCAFFLLAGGLGERLGFKGAKPCMILDPVTELTFLQLYCEYIKAYQDLFSGQKVTLPFCIMVVEETKKNITQYLEANDYCGLQKEQFYFLEQSSVPAVLNCKGELDLDEETGDIQFKPFGHGECHLLMHRSGLAQKLKNEGFEWITFFNDTNPLAFRFLPSYLGVCKQKKWETAFICVKRKVGDAIGGIAVVQTKQGKFTTNVEYNVLDKLRQANPEPTDEEGFSKLPGNINFIIISLKSYADTLNKTQGVVPEFINPKLAADGITFKSAARMETLISEYPYLLPPGSQVGVIQCADPLMCFSCAKNELTLGRQRQEQCLSIETCGSCQFDYYQHNQMLLEKVGVEFDGARKYNRFSGIKYEFGSIIVLHPSFAPTLRDLIAAVRGKVRVANGSFLELKGKVILDGLDLDGSIRIVNDSVKPIQIAGVVHHNKQYVTFEDLCSDHHSADYDDKIRGFVTLGKSSIEAIPSSQI